MSVNMIKALYDFEGNSDMELSVRRGQILELVADADDYWYFAHEPVSNKEGFVPKSFMEHVCAPPNDKDSAFLSFEFHQSQIGHVLHDFDARADDEFSAHRRDIVEIVEDFDPNWISVRSFRSRAPAKLIPRSYVEIFAEQTRRKHLHRLRRSSTPEKSMAMDEQPKRLFRHSSSSLEVPKHQGIDVSSGDVYGQSYVLFEHRNIHEKKSTENPLEAFLRQYKFSPNGKAWILTIDVVHHDTGKTARIRRTYEQFFDMHKRLLQMFPYTTDGKRIIPYMPGPDGRNRKEFDAYLKALLSLSDEIVSCDAVREFFARGDHCNGNHHNNKILRPTWLKQKISIPIDQLLSSPSAKKKKFKEEKNSEASPTADPLTPVMKNGAAKKRRRRHGKLQRHQTSSSSSVSLQSHEHRSERTKLSRNFINSSSVSLGSDIKRHRPRVVGSFKIKVQYEHQHVAVRVTATTQYTTFLKKLAVKLNNIELSEVIGGFLYMDEEGDWIHLLNEDDFRVALASTTRRNLRMNTLLKNSARSNS